MVAVDQTTGHVAVAWHDARDSPTNTANQAYFGISTDLGVSFTNQPAAASLSNPIGFETSHGDYLGIAFHAGRCHVAWTDNSNVTLDNPDLDCGQGVPCMDVYVPEPSAVVQLLPGSLAVAGLHSHRRRRGGSDGRPAEPSSIRPTPT